MKTDENNTSVSKRLLLFPGVSLSYLELSCQDKICYSHPEDKKTLVLQYCAAGHMDWQMTDGTHLYLGAKDYAVYTMGDCAHSQVRLPNGFFRGFLLFFQEEILAKNPLPVLSESGVDTQQLFRKFSRSDLPVSFTGSEDSESIFRYFYSESAPSAYQRLKALETILYLQSLPLKEKNRMSEYQTRQVEIVRAVHARLLEDLSKRYTIEELAKEYLMNPTTLKSVFKKVYGLSLAAHMKEHRMEQAAKLLCETDYSISEIAHAVGYDSQSKFASAFEKEFHCLPTVYRKNGGVQ